MPLPRPKKRSPPQTFKWQKGFKIWILRWEDYPGLSAQCNNSAVLKGRCNCRREVQRESTLPPEKGPCTWACGCILENEKDKKMNSLLQLPKGCSASNILILAKWVSPFNRYICVICYAAIKHECSKERWFPQIIQLYGLESS